MYTNDVPIEQISALCAHESVTTTARYIKRHLVKPVEANDREVVRAPHMPLTIALAVGGKQHNFLALLGGDHRLQPMPT